MIMNRDNISAVVMAIAVVSVIAGFAIYFNTQGSNISSKSISSTDEFIPLTGQIDENGEMINIDKSQFKKAKNFTKISEYINTKPISLDDLKDKVVLVDFWTYSCINCIRTIPHLNEWYDKYSDKGLVIVGIHTPEFEFEKNSDNVKSAVQKFGIKYPILQDNDKETWNEYENRYWPRKYLIDDEGYIRYDHIGEGAYSETEKVIQALLTERAAHLGMKNINLNESQNVDSESRLESQEVNFSNIKSPELYFGYEFARSPLGNIEDFKPNQIASYNLLENSEIKPNQIYLEGKWKNNPDNMELQSNNGSIILKYNSKSVNIVAGGENSNFTVTQDRKLITNDLSKDASSEGKFVIDKQRLYNLVTNKDYGEHTIEIDVKGKGFQIYTFTFG
jgi:thiol-disulfide isomerase/thioredoxin